jgi:hypothetical protein
METAFRIAALAHAKEALFLNSLYWLAIMCVVFKLTWIIRQVGLMPAWQRWPTAFSAAALSFILLAKAYFRFQGGDDAQVLDIAREMALCFFLVSAIVMIRGLTNKF